MKIIINKLLSEYSEDDFSALDSFYIKDDFCRKVYDENDIMFDDVRNDLIEIAEDFYETTNLAAEIQDIILVGSLANYNWSQRFSDFDLHLVIDFESIGDKELIFNYAWQSKKIWNDNNDIKLRGFDVEVYIQDIDEEVMSSGQYSILRNEWIRKPERYDFMYEEDDIRKVAEGVMEDIDFLEENFDSYDYDKFILVSSEIWETIKSFRKDGLASADGEFSVGNLTFKFLRRNGYIGRLLKLRQLSYNKKFK